jgi:hypothetical protein
VKRAWIAAGVLASVPVFRAAAYQSPTRFIAPAVEGGGGGRFFSGSPADSLTCDVCHGDKPSARLDILGLPEGGYEYGRAYRVIVDWDDTLESVALNLEVTDAQGHAFGTLTAAPMQQLTPADLCRSTGLPDVVVGSGERQLALVTACGGHQASLVWEAPAGVAMDGSSEAWFSGSLVAADTDGTVRGDGVTNIQRVLGPARAETPVASDLRADCSVRPSARASNKVTGFLLSLVGLVALRRRLRRSRQ